jgi:molybdenum cofactor cytidylyltransferase
MPGGRIPAIVLAAGGSTRSIVPKQLLTFRGTSLLRHAAETALGSGCRPVYVVLGARGCRLTETVSGLPVIPVRNPWWDMGLGSSIRCGVQAALIADPELEAVLLMTVDQPLVTTAVIDQLVSCYREGNAPVVACAYESTIGVPALFGRDLVPTLLALQGDRGAKEVIHNQGEAATLFQCPEAAYDIDTESDLPDLTEIS